MVVGVSAPTVNLTNTNSAEVGVGANLLANGGVLGSSQNISLLANSNDTAQALATGAGGAVIAIETATANGTLNDLTAMPVMANATILATGSVQIESQALLNGTVNPVVNTGGLGVGAEADGTLIVTNTVTTDIGGGASISGANVTVLAHLLGANITDQASATATAAGDSSKSTATLSDTFNTLLTIEGGATITGSATATFQALQDSIVTTSEADATSNAAFASTTPTATNTLADTADVTAVAGSEVDTRSLDVEADAPAIPLVNIIANQNGTWAGATFGSPTFNGTLTLDREIHWYGLVRELGAPDPTLLVDPLGNVTAAGIIFTETSSAVNVNNIAYTGVLPGKALFRIASSIYDGVTSSGALTVHATALFSPAPTIDFSSTFNKITIENQSTLALNINGINPLNATAQVASDIVFQIPGNPVVTPVVNIVPGPTTILIENDGTQAAAPDVNLLGNIANPLGTTFISANKGNIVAGPNEQLETTTLWLNAGKAIGSSLPTALVAAPRVLEIAATGAVTASAGADLHLLQSGDLILAGITAGTTADLSASGSILNDPAATLVAAPVVVLNAAGGSIGTANGHITVNTASLTAAAAQGIWIDGFGPSLTLGAISSTSGTVAITDTGNITIPAGGNVHAFAGSLSLQAGASFKLLPAGDLSAAGTVGITGDATGSGAVVDLRGTVTAPSVFVTTGNGSDTVDLSGLTSPTTVQLGTGNDTVAVGSNVLPPVGTTPLSNSNGLLSGVRAALDIIGPAAAAISNPAYLNNDVLIVDDPATRPACPACWPVAR